MIGIFDSGVGGMTVARAIEQVCPGLPIVYFGDIARTPYGTKSPETIIEYCRKNTDFLISQGARMIVVACNSAAATGAEALRQHHAVPILDVILPATIRAANVSRTGRIGVIGTRATIQSGIYERRLQEVRPESRVFGQPAPLLVPLVEENWLNRRETKMIIRKYLHPLRQKQIDTLVLGCTHYPLLKHLIGPRIGRRVALVDSSLELAGYLNRFLEERPQLREALEQARQPSRFFVSDLTDPVRKLAERIFGRTITLERVDV